MERPANRLKSHRRRGYASPACISTLSAEETMSEDKLAQFANQNYINLQTFKKDGTPVTTPVWFAEDGGELYVYTLANSGKMKRLRNNRRVRIAVANARGKLKGEWVEGEARLLDQAESAKGNRRITE